MSCPDPLVLSQLSDDELPAAEAAALAGHVADCASCRGWLERSQRALAALSDAAARGSGSRILSRTSDCPAPSSVAGWRDPTLPAVARAAMSRHLEACDACLADTLAASRLLARLDATPAHPVPAALRAQVGASWTQRGATEPSLSEIVVRVTRAGAKLLESHLLAPLRELVELPMPLPALRSSVPAEALYFCLHASAATITATVVPAGDGVGLTLVIEDSTGGVLAGQRVFVRRHGRSIFSARTDASGALRMPSLEPAVHEVSCPGIGTSFRLDLRGS